MSAHHAASRRAGDGQNRLANREKLLDDGPRCPPPGSHLRALNHFTKVTLQGLRRTLLYRKLLYRKLLYRKLLHRKLLDRKLLYIMLLYRKFHYKSCFAGASLPHLTCSRRASRPGQ